MKNNESLMKKLKIIKNCTVPFLLVSFIAVCFTYHSIDDHSALYYSLRWHYTGIKPPPYLLEDSKDLFDPDDTRTILYHLNERSLSNIIIEGLHHPYYSFFKEVDILKKELDDLKNPTYVKARKREIGYNDTVERRKIIENLLYNHRRQKHFFAYFVLPLILWFIPFYYCFWFFVWFIEGWLEAYWLATNYPCTSEKIKLMKKNYKRYFTATLHRKKCSYSWGFTAFKDQDGKLRIKMPHDEHFDGSVQDYNLNIKEKHSYFDSRIWRGDQIQSVNGKENIDDLITELGIATKLEINLMRYMKDCLVHVKEIDVPRPLEHDELVMEKYHGDCFKITQYNPQINSGLNMDIKTDDIVVAANGTDGSQLDIQRAMKKQGKQSLTIVRVLPPLKKECEFVVILKHQDGMQRSLGLELVCGKECVKSNFVSELLDGEEMVYKVLPDREVDRWNKAHYHRNPLIQIVPGAIITSVNGRSQVRERLREKYQDLILRVRIPWMEMPSFSRKQSSTIDPGTDSEPESTFSSQREYIESNNSNSSLESSKSLSSRPAPIMYEVHIPIFKGIIVQSDEKPSHLFNKQINNQPGLIEIYNTMVKGTQNEIIPSDTCWNIETHPPYMGFNYVTMNMLRKREMMHVVYFPVTVARCSNILEKIQMASSTLPTYHVNHLSSPPNHTFRIKSACRSLIYKSTLGGMNMNTARYTIATTQFLPQDIIDSVNGVSGPEIMNQLIHGNGDLHFIIGRCYRKEQLTQYRWDVEVTNPLQNPLTVKEVSDDTIIVDKIPEQLISSGDIMESDIVHSVNGILNNDDMIEECKKEKLILTLMRWLPISSYREYHITIKASSGKLGIVLGEDTEFPERSLIKQIYPDLGVANHNENEKLEMTQKLRLDDWIYAINGQTDIVRGLEEFDGASNTHLTIRRPLPCLHINPYPCSWSESINIGNYILNPYNISEMLRKK